MTVDHVQIVSGESGEYVIRADPANRPDGMRGMLLAQYYPGSHTSGSHWIIRVRRWAEDPFGPVLAEQVVSGDYLKTELQRWRDRVKAGWKPGDDVS